MPNPNITHGQHLRCKPVFEASEIDCLDASEKPAERSPSMRIVAHPDMFRARGVNWKFLPTRAEALERRRQHIKLLRRARRPRKYPVDEQTWTLQRRSMLDLTKRLQACRRDHRCASLACAMCRRTWARAQFHGLIQAAEEMQRHWRTKRLVFGTVVPHGIYCPETTLYRLRVAGIQSQLRDALSRVDVDVGALIGVLEISYEEVVGGTPYFQPHWHFLAMTDGPAALEAALGSHFAWPNQANPPVRVREVYDLAGAASYLCKVVEKGHRWQGARTVNLVRRVLPLTRQREVLLWLDQHPPIGFLIEQNLEIDLVEIWNREDW